MIDRKGIHTIIGAGQIGTQLAHLLAEQGYQVRLVRRGAPGEAIPGVTWMQGDATDRAFIDRACAGAAAVYNTANPPDYAGWDGVIQPLYRAIWEAAGRAGARLVQLDNLYMYGRPTSAPFAETAPEVPCRQMGEIRKAMGDELRAMHERGEVDMVIARASDYFGPATPNGAVFRPENLDAIRKGGTVNVFGDPDQPHAYTYSPDVARALATLGTAVGPVTGRVWFVPTTWKGTTRELVDAMGAAAGTRVRTRRIPGFVLRAAGLFVPVMRAVAEMSYQWDLPYVLDDSDFRRTFGIEPTPVDEAIGATLGLVERATSRAA